MNFEFLKGLTGLGYIYENCSNAEKLAYSMPVQSVFTSRKSAELLAKFVYMAAHNREMEMLTFADILSDPIVQRFISSRQVINAFHHIRKSGNRAVHGDDQESSEDAVAVLQDLHYVAGETARMLGLIKQYPRFNNKIESIADGKYVEEQDTERKAREMFFQYIEKYDAQKERDHYYSQRVDRLLNDFDDYTSSIQIIPNIQEVNETLEFYGKPVFESTLKQIQEHFIFLGIQYIKYMRGEIKENRVFKYSCKLTIKGETGYSTIDLFEFIQGIRYDLAKSDGFIVESHYTGPALYLNHDVREEFREIVPKMDEKEHFKYCVYEYFGLSGQAFCDKYENGHWINLEDEYTESIIDKDYDSPWESYELRLEIDFDFEKYPQIIKAAHETVMKHMPPEEYEYCKDYLEDAQEDECFGLLIAGAGWYPNSLREIQDFLDVLNSIINPIIHECTGYCEGKWYMTKSPFAVATWEWTDKGFRIIGTEL